MELTKKNLSFKINHYRNELIKIGKEKGLNNSETIQLSQNLDKLIFKYQKL